MKKSLILLTCSTLLLAANVQAKNELDSLKSMIGLSDKKEQSTSTNSTQTTDALSISGMLSQVSNSLNVTQKQAEGGIASLFSFAKDNSSSTDFSQLAKSIPGVDSILSKVPSIGKSSGGLGGLLDQASQYSDSIKSVNNIKKQFEALGLSPEMISQFITQAQSYLDTEQGQQAKDLLTQGLAKLIN